MSALWFAIPLCLALAPVVVLYREAVKERRERDGCGLCRRWEPVDCSCPRRCTAMVCPRKEGTR